MITMAESSLGGEEREKSARHDACAHDLESEMTPGRCCVYPGLCFGGEPTFEAGLPANGSHTYCLSFMQAVVSVVVFYFFYSVSQLSKAV